MEKRKIIILFFIGVIGITPLYANSENQIEAAFFKIIKMALNDDPIDSKKIAEITQTERKFVKRGFYEYLDSSEDGSNVILRFNRYGGRGSLKYNSTKDKTYYNKKFRELDIRYTSRNMSIDDHPIWIYEGLTNNGYQLNLKLYGCSTDPTNPCTQEMELIFMIPSKGMRILDR